MRTTLSLDDDVAALLKKAAADRKVSFKTLVNEALRSALTSQPRKGKRRRRLTRTHDGGRTLIDLTSVSEALAVLDGEDHR
jgi:hypothetical protein